MLHLPMFFLDFIVVAIAFQELESSRQVCLFVFECLDALSCRVCALVVRNHDKLLTIVRAELFWVAGGMQGTLGLSIEIF